MGKDEEQMASHYSRKKRNVVQINRKIEDTETDDVGGGGDDGCGGCYGRHDKNNATISVSKWLC